MASEMLPKYNWVVQSSYSIDGFTGMTPARYKNPRGALRFCTKNGCRSSTCQDQSWGRLAFHEFHAFHWFAFLKMASNMNSKEKPACNCNCNKDCWHFANCVVFLNTVAFASATAPSQTLLPVSACSWLSIGRRSGSSPSKMAISPILSVSEPRRNEVPLGEFHMRFWCCC